jgi:hypothetical protein
MKTLRVEFRAAPEERACLAALARADCTDVSTVVRTLIREAYVRRFGEVTPDSPPVVRTSVELPSTPTALHELLVGNVPSTSASALYARHPELHGVATPAPTDDEVDASLVLAVARAIGTDGPVIVFEAPPLRDRVSARIHGLSARAFARLREHRGPGAAPVARRLGAALEHLRFGRPSAWPAAAPASWIALGLGPGDASLPGWLLDGLLRGEGA